MRTLIFFQFYTYEVNNMVADCIFPVSIKLANIALAYNKEQKRIKAKLQTCKHIAKYIKNLRRMSL